MKQLTKILFVMIAISLVFSFNGLLNAEKKAEGNKEMKCAVCKTAIKGEAKFKTEYKGNTYYFASEKCMETFKKDPAKFIAACAGAVYVCPKEGCKYKANKPGQCPQCKVDLKKHECKVAYVCPMKQCNVKTDKPGKCPKCGMKLKKAPCCGPEAHKHEHKDEHKHEHKHGKECDHKH